jgi:hypothetical protein
MKVVMKMRMNKRAIREFIIANKAMRLVVRKTDALSPKYQSFSKQSELFKSEIDTELLIRSKS